VSTKRASAVGMRKAVAAPAAPALPEEDPFEEHGFGRAAAAPVPYAKPVRVTLDLDPVLYAGLTQWANAAATEAGLPRLPLARALRAMIRVTLADRGIAAVVIDQARRDSEG